ncbi:hypothetical protein, partial [Pseudomonas sp. A25(2017)]|uniref:hypothetical protein n=1 Tax=Pseudomonas sp. A25(2017) TaxID=1945865 RepID=UPI001C4433C0
MLAMTAAHPTSSAQARRYREQAQLPQGIYGESLICERSKTSVGAEPARDDGDTSNIIGTDTPPSRASSLPQGIYGERLICERSKTSVGAEFARDDGDTSNIIGTG